MRTIPDTIDLIKNKLIRILDCYYSIIESIRCQVYKLWLDIKDGVIDRKLRL